MKLLFFNIRALLILAFLLLGSTSARVFAQSKIVTFERITIDDGLSQNSIRKITQDKDGFIWIATEDGLNRYDGYNFKIIGHEPHDPYSLTNNMVLNLHLSEKNKFLWIATVEGVNIINTEDLSIQHLKDHIDESSTLPTKTINCIFKDSQERIWIGTINGLNLLDPQTKALRTFRNSNLSSEDIRVIIEDHQGFIWIGTDNGLSKITTTEDHSIEVITHLNTSSEKPITNNEITALYQESPEKLWVGTEDGLNIINLKSDDITHVTVSNNGSISDNRITSIYESTKNTIWVGTKSGLNRLKKQNKDSFIFDNFFNNDTNEHSLSNNWISSIFEDNSGILWVGTYFGGINKLRLYGKQFYSYKSYSDNPNSISSNVIRSITKDSKNQMLWIGTNPGLNKVDLKTGQVTRYLNKPTNKGGLNNDIIRSLCLSDSRKLWIGTGRKGINIFDPLTETFSYITHDSIGTSGFKGRDIRTIIQDSQGYIWAGSNDHGLNKIDPKTMEVVNFMPDSSDMTSIGSKYIYHIKEDQLSNLWIATYDGIDYYDRAIGEFLHYRSNKNDTTSIPANYVKCIEVTKDGDVWMGTAGAGFAKLIDKETGTFKTYSSKHGLANNFIYGILEDNNKNLWISTNRGISKFDPRTEKFLNFKEIDGIQGNEFNTGAFYRSDEGQMYFGGINGLTYFYPDSIKLNEVKPNVTITDIQVFNKSIFDFKNKQYHHIVTKLKSDSILELTHEKNVISFEFSSLDFTSPEKNKFAYKMEGFDKDWVYTNANKRFTTYTNLPSGNYTFLLKGSNNDGIWSDKTYQLTIFIEPPFYAEVWFIALMTLLLIVGVYSVHLIRLKGLQVQKKYLTEEVKNQTAEINAKNEELEHRQAEILTQNEELERQTRKLENSYENVRMLSDIGHEITSLLNINDILGKVYSRINIVMNAPKFSIGLYDAKKNTVTNSIFNINGEKEDNSVFSLDSERFSCWCIKNKKPIWLGNVKNNYSEHIAHIDEYKKDELLKSIICIPMIIGEKVLGIVSIQSPEEDAYSKYHFDILSTLTSYITVAIDNANSYQLLEQKVDERTADVKKAYEELVLANMHFDQFTYRSAHDLRGPLARILGLCHLGILETKDKKGQEYLNHLEKVAFEMDHMLSRLLRTHHNKTRELSTSRVFIRDAVQQVLDYIEKKRKLSKVEIHIEIPEELSFETDPFLFSILIESVLDNAIQFQDYSKKDSMLSIKAHTEDDNHLRIHVRDNGIGINKEFQKRIFDMFFVGSDTTKGSGLGLYEATIIANKLNGHIQLLHSDKEYTEFEIYL